MAEPFLSEIRIMSFNFAPKGWALCNGQLLPINQNQALFSLLGTTYGGDGRVNFALPNLQGRVPSHPGQGQTPGQSGGGHSHPPRHAAPPAHTPPGAPPPKPIRQVFGKRFWSRRRRADLAAIMLPDSASIQEMEVEQLNRRRLKRGQEEVEPIYTL